MDGEGRSGCGAGLALSWYRPYCELLNRLTEKTYLGDGVTDYWIIGLLDYWVVEL